MNSILDQMKSGETPFTETQRLEKAKKHMSNASTSLEILVPEDAEREMEDVLKNLDEAEKRMRNKKEEFLGFQKEELIFQIKDQLEGFKEKQDKINLETKDIHFQGKEGKYSRSQKIFLRKIRRRQISLKDEVKEAEARLKEEGAPVLGEGSATRVALEKLGALLAIASVANDVAFAPQAIVWTRFIGAEQLTGIHGRHLLHSWPAIIPLSPS